MTAAEPSAAVHALLAVELYTAEHRVPGTPLIAGPGWIPDEPVELRSLRPDSG